MDVRHSAARQRSPAACSPLGASARRDLQTRQIRRACQLLLDTDWTVRRIADACGMGHPEHLSRFMRKQVGESPTDYRRRRRVT